MADLGPTGLANVLMDRIADAKAALADAATRAERKGLNRSLHRHRQLLGWCQSRAGYRTAVNLTKREGEL